MQWQIICGRLAQQAADRGTRPCDKNQRHTCIRNTLLHTTLLLLKLASRAGSISAKAPNTLIALSVLWDSISGLCTSIATYSSNSKSTSNSNSTRKPTMASILDPTDIKCEAEEERLMSRLLVILVMPMLEQTITLVDPRLTFAFTYCWP